MILCTDQTLKSPGTWDTLNCYWQRSTGLKRCKTSWPWLSQVKRIDAGRHRHCIKQRTRINETANQTNQLNVSRASHANYSHTFLKSQLDDVPTSATTTAATEGETLLTQLTPKMNSPNDVACGTFF